MLLCDLLQQGPQGLNVSRALDCEHPLDQLPARGGPQHRRNQVAAFGDDLIARHSLDPVVARDVIAKGMLGDQPLPLK